MPPGRAMEIIVITALVGYAIYRTVTVSQV